MQEMNTREKPKHTGCGSCRELYVKPDVCYIRFSGEQIVESQELEPSTSRGEQLILDLDREGRIVGIELLGSAKPCQQ